MQILQHKHRDAMFKAPFDERVVSDEKKKVLLLRFREKKGEDCTSMIIFLYKFISSLLYFLITSYKVGLNINHRTPKKEKEISFK